MSGYVIFTSISTGLKFVRTKSHTNVNLPKIIFSSCIQDGL